MVKAFGITTVLAAILVVLFLVFPAIFGIRGDKEAEVLLASAGVIETFSNNKGPKASKQDSQDSPLVKQAEAFALYLNPPPNPKKIAQKTTPGQVTRAKPKKVSAKFELLGTSFYSQNPKMSLVLIDEPGKGFRWVRQSGKIGHLVVKEIKDGIVVMKDGDRTFELAPERKPKRSLLKDKETSARKAPSWSKPPVEPEVAIPAVAAIERFIPPEMSELDEEELQNLVEELRALQATDRDDLEHGDSETEMIDKLVSEFRATRISKEEAEELDELGKELENADKDINKPADSKTGRVTRTRRPTRRSRTK